jgi:hypothetical protein
MLDGSARKTGARFDLITQAGNRKNGMKNLAKSSCILIGSVVS